MTDYKGATLQYRDVARKIEKMHILFEFAGIKQGDKIALCGRNSANWTAVFLSIITYGAVAVPILHEFKADNVHNVVNHSEARMMFVGDQVWENFNETAMPRLEGIIELKTSKRRVRKTVSMPLPCRKCLLSPRKPRRTGGHQLHFGHYGILERRYAALPLHHLEHPAYPYESWSAAGRQRGVNAPVRTYLRVDLRLPLRRNCRCASVVPHPYAFA